ncbi:MAG: hypothetical protein HW387_863 [Parachlamydiales bacterium]|nr:hypothetical protein [Parachlamydiales bacterium]
MIAKEILSEIDATLEQLIRNAQTLEGTPISDLTETELDAFQKTQESLLHHLIHMDQAYETNRKPIPLQNERSVIFKIQEKHQRFEKLKKTVSNTILNAEKKRPIFTKRTAKRLIRSIHT